MKLTIHDAICGAKYSLLLGKKILPYFKVKVFYMALVHIYARKLLKLATTTYYR